MGKTNWYQIITKQTHQEYFIAGVLKYISLKETYLYCIWIIKFRKFTLPALTDTNSAYI